MKHYQFGGSTAKRTEHCQAWITLSEGIPNIESEAASTGTNIHWMLEQANLDIQLDFNVHLDTVCPETGKVIDADQVELAKEIWDVDQALCAAYDVHEWEAECTGEYSIHIGSTVDKVFKGITPEGLPCTVLIDYKSGRGVQVDAVGNEQLLHNAWCLMENSPAQDLFDDAKVLVGVIIQPDRAGVVVAKEWRFNKQDVELFAARHLANIDLARSGKAKPNAGSHCTFCPAAATCPAKTGAARAALLRDPANIAELAENMAMVEELKKWCNAVEKATYETLELGQEVPGWKLVAKRAMEHWMDEDLATKRLRLRVGGIKNLMVQKLISPAEARKRLVANGMEKSVADQMVSNLTKKESSGTTIAPETDKRPGVLSTEALSAALASVV